MPLASTKSLAAVSKLDFTRAKLLLSHNLTQNRLGGSLALPVLKRGVTKRRWSAVLLTVSLVIGGIVSLRLAAQDRTKPSDKTDPSAKTPVRQSQRPKSAPAAEQPTRGAVEAIKPSTEDAPSESARPENEVPPSRRDPFSNTPTIAREFDQRQNSSAAPQPAATAAEQSVVPDMQMRGFADDGVQPPLALIELAKAGVFLVRKGDRLNITDGGLSFNLEIEDISDAGALVKVNGRPDVVVVK